MLSLQNVHKSFRDTIAVDNISIDVKKGSIFGLLGPNGAGKTTTIRMIMNILKPDRGTILFNDELCTENIRNQIGYLPEERGLYQKMKLSNTLLYFSSLKDVEKQEAKKQINEWLERFDLLRYSDRKIEELSKGNQQKVQFIASVLHDPEIIILDEPFTGLDPVNQTLLKEIISEMKQQERTIIFSTHQMEQIEKLCDDICLLNHGRQLLYGSLKEIKHQYGGNSIVVEFSGDSSYLRKMALFKKVDIYENYAEVVPNANIKSSEVLRQLIDKIDIRKFQVVESSLHNIFIEQVQGQQEKGNA